MTTQRPFLKYVDEATPSYHPLSVRKLQSSLRNCLSWCRSLIQPPQRQIDVATVFRSEEMRNAAESVFPFSCHTVFSQSVSREFETFVRKRTQLLEDEVSIETTKLELRRPKSLLVMDWSASLFDGALTPETDGFLNDDAMPPWDTWITLVHAKESHGMCCLLSWVPNWLSEKVDFAISADAGECFSWLVVEARGTRTLGWGRRWKD